MATRSRRTAAAITVALLLTGCADDDGGSASLTTATTTSTPATSVPEPTTTTASTPSTSAAPAVPVTIGVGERCAEGSSPAAVDETRGLYAAWVTSIDVDDSTLGVDVIQWLTGDEADDAYHLDNPGDPGGVPNDYYIVNESTQVRTFGVADDVEVRVLSTGATLIDSTFDALPAALGARAPAEGEQLSYNPYWIAVNGGEITGICEQYVP